ncbi:MAG: STAS domain-containing protein [Chloroflexi bacterium]|nr:STAS domain-containing protein [Chloroflexota bacterium]
MNVAEERTGEILTVLLDGRLDAFGASQLESALKGLVRDGDSAMVIDMKRVPYLSSGGIRVLVASQKMLRKRGGGVHLCCLSSYPSEVLAMAGFDQFFAIHATRDEAVKSCLALREVSRGQKEWQRLPTFRQRDADFTVFDATHDPAVLKVVGSLQKVLHAQLQPGDIFLRRFSETEYSIGLGALGGSLDDCLHVLGEMMTIGGTMVWLPTDGNDTPDFLIPQKDTGGVVIRTGLNVALSGPFNEIAVVECTSELGLSVADLYASLFAIAKERHVPLTGLMSVAMLADVVGVYSSGVKISPVKELAPANGGMIMDQANVGTWMDISTEPKHRGKMMASFGIGIDLTADMSAFEREKLDSLFYLHPANIGQKTMLLHNHGVIFESLPWGRASLDLDNEIRRVVREGQFLDMRHLLDNTRISRAVAGISHIQDIVFEQAAGGH